MSQNTPSYAMYNEFKAYWHIAMKDLAPVLFSPDARFGGRTLEDRMKTRSWLTRNIFAVQPGTISSSQFQRFDVAAQDVIKLLKPQNDENLTPELISRFSKDAADAMCSALAGYELDYHLYRNMVRVICELKPIRELDRATGLVMLFIETGCLGDPKAAVRDTKHFLEHATLSTHKTSIADTPEASDGGTPQASGNDLRLALYRTTDGRITSQPYVLSCEADGTEIGRLATSTSSITDVGASVSKNHLRIWRAADGQWLAQGLGSTNGTVIVRGDGTGEGVIELPRDKRASGVASEPVAIFPGDTLVLAKTTSFIVVVAPTQ